jgi:hypothetical protein
VRSAYRTLMRTGIGLVGRDAKKLAGSTVGALILARAVDDERLSDEILSVVRKDLA